MKPIALNLYQCENGALILELLQDRSRVQNGEEGVSKSQHKRDQKEEDAREGLDHVNQHQREHAKISEHLEMK